MSFTPAVRAVLTPLIGFAAFVALLYGACSLAQRIRYRRDEQAAFTFAWHELEPAGQPFRRRFFVAWMAVFVLVGLGMWMER